MQRAAFACMNLAHLPVAACLVLLGRAGLCARLLGVGRNVPRAHVSGQEERGIWQLL